MRRTTYRSQELTLNEARTKEDVASLLAAGADVHGKDVSDGVCSHCMCTRAPPCRLTLRLYVHDTLPRSVRRDAGF